MCMYVSVYIYKLEIKWLSIKCHMCMYMHVFACILAVSCCMPCLTLFFAVSLGCFHDDVRSEPGSWLVVGMIPVFDKKKSMRDIEGTRQTA